MIRTVKKPEERRKEIVATARELFLKNDYEKTTIEDVMKKLDIAKGTVYHYFKSKEELLEAVVQNMVDEYLAGLQSSIKQAKGNALNRLRLLVAAADVSDEPTESLQRLHSQGNVGLHTRFLAVTITRMAPLYADVIRQGCEEGLFKTNHPLEAAELMLAGIQFLTDLGCYPWSQKDLARRRTAIPALIEAQLKAPKGSFDSMFRRSKAS